MEKRVADENKELRYLLFYSTLPAMFRFAIILAGLLWASLLLISWSAPPEQTLETSQVQTGDPYQRN